VSGGFATLRRSVGRTLLRSVAKRDGLSGNLYEKPVALPHTVIGDVKQAIYHFNKQYQVVKLSFPASMVGWRP
jgi:hypothetical protein